MLTHPDSSTRLLAESTSRTRRAEQAMSQRATRSHLFVKFDD